MQKPEDYVWSSARAHRLGKNDKLVKVAPLLRRAGRWQDFIGHDDLTGYDSAEKLEKLRKQGRTGRPVGSVAFIEKLERQLGRALTRQKLGPKTFRD